MTSLVLHPTDVAQWHALVGEAQAATERRLDETLESYLVFLLMRFADQPQMTERIMALDYLEAVAGETLGQRDKLRDVGDQCLLFSGLFPQIAERRRVKVSYFVRLGRSAYDQLAVLADRKSEQLYTSLAHAFVAVMDVLHAIRALNGTPALTALQASQLWADTGSRVAYATLRNHYQVEPFAQRSDFNKR